MNCLIYLRKSRADTEAELRGEGETLVRHEKILMDLAKRQHLSIGAIYREIVSGETIAARPMMQQLLSEVEQGRWDGVLVVEVERLARGDTIDQGLVSQAFKYSNTKIITPIKTYDPANEFDEEYFEFGLFMSRREYKTINRRLQQGRLQATKEGRYIGSIAPYGYKKTRIDKMCTLEPDEKEAPIVKLIFDLYTTGKNGRRVGTKIIANTLNEMGIPTRKGGDWTPATIIPMLRNPVYFGKVKWNFRKVIKKVENGIVTPTRPRNGWEHITIVDGLHPAIISEEQFLLAQKLLSANPPSPAPAWKVTKNPLAAICKCGKCHKTMLRRNYQNRADMIYCNNTKCDNVGSDLKLVYDRIILELCRFLDSYRIEWNSGNLHQTNDIKCIQEKLYTLEKEQKTLEEQLSKQYDLLEQGIYSQEIFLQRNQSISQKLKSISLNQSEAKKQLQILQEKQTAQNEVIPRFEQAIQLLSQTSDPAQQNAILKEVLEKVLYLKNESSRWNASPDDFKVILYPKI